MIKVNHLQFNYGRSCVYYDFSLELTLPGIYGLFGRNGSGKSTLLKILSGLLFSRSGIVEVLGFRPSDRAPTFLEQVYFVPEEFHLPNITLEVLASIHSTFYPHFSNSDFQRYIQIFEIPQGKNFSAMSLGQKKKAAIAFALATCTPVLLMDEPTNGLDIVSRSQFKSLLQSPEQARRVILISTHQAHDLESVLQHIWFIDGGQLVLSASMTALAQQLRMGVALHAADLPPPAQLLYQESLGAHTAWVAKAPSNAGADFAADEASPIQLELLYKALSLHQAQILAATQNAEAAT